jgi:hypothetical protein
MQEEMYFEDFYPGQSSIPYAPTASLQERS